MELSLPTAQCTCGSTRTRATSGRRAKLQRISCQVSKPLAAERHFCSHREPGETGALMKKFLAVYIGMADAREKSGWDKLEPAELEKRQGAGIRAWQDWMAK